MNKNITANEEQLEEFFGVKGKPLDINMQWPFNEYLYEVSRDGMELSVSIHPTLKDVRIILAKDENTIFESNRMAIQDITIETDGDAQSLVIHGANNQYLLIRVEPNIQIEDYVGE